MQSISPDLPVSVAEQTLPTGVDRIDADVNAVAQIDGNDTRIDADVAVLDTGVDLSNPDLNVAGGVDCDGPDTGNYGDAHGHGTHIAGTIAALDNGIGVVGVAPGARIWSVRVLDAYGNGTTSNLICGLDWVAAHADTIDVVNMSLAGAGSDGSCSSTALHEAICGVVNAGVTVVAAAGNSG
ncbi:MAG: peptidase S8, partial [Chloroflexota bacterium]